MLPTEGIAAKESRAPWLKANRLALEARRKEDEEVNARPALAFFTNGEATDIELTILSRRHESFREAACAANLAGLDSNWPRAFQELASLSNDWGKVLAGSAIADVHGRENLTQVRKILNSVRY